MYSKDTAHKTCDNVSEIGKRINRTLIYLICENLSKEKKVRSWLCTICAYGEASKVWCYKNQCCIGTRNVRSMNQAKLEVVIQDMARVNINILGINEVKWTGKGDFNSEDRYIYYCGQESLRRNGVALIVNKSPKCSTWVQSQKWQNDLCSFPRQTIQHHSNPCLCPNY